MTHLQLLRKNLTRKKLRLALTIFSIFTAFLIFGVLKTFDSALNAGVELSGADRLVTISKVSLIQPLPFAHYTKIKAIEGVENATHASWFGGYYQDPKNILAAFAVDAQSYLDIYPEILIPEDQRNAFMNNRRGALVGEALVKLFGWKVGDTLPLQSNIWTNQDGSHTWELQIEAIFTGKDDEIDTRAVMFHYDYFNESKTAAKDTIGWLVIKTESPALNEAVSAAIDGQFENSPNETKTDTEEAFSKAFLEQFGNIGLIITSVVGAAFFTILLIAGNTMVAPANTQFVIDTLVKVQAANLADGEAEIALCHVFSASGGGPSHTWSLEAGTLAPGLSLEDTGVVCGTPTQGGDYGFTLRHA